jgi:CIC family chloride channel protein
MKIGMRATQSIVGKIRTAVSAELAKRTPSENTFLALIPVVGAATGMAAIGIAHSIAFLQKLFWGGGESLLGWASQVPWHVRILVPACGGAVLGLMGWLLRMDLQARGTSAVIEALALRGGVISLRKTIPRVIAGIVTLSSGGSLGREGPMIQFGSALGSRLGRQFKLSTQQLRILVCCAASSGIAAAYNAPFAATIFSMEILIGNFALEIFGPVVIASLISTLIFRAARGDLPWYVIPEYKLASNWELIGYLILGVLAGILSVVFIKTLGHAQDAFAKMKAPAYAKPVIGFTLLGLIGAVFPHVFGNGYDTVNMALHEELPLLLLLILPLAKLAATALTLSCGGSGGLFTPTLMVGALLGGAFGWGAHTLFPNITAPHGAYALVGMGAIIAGTTHAPITAILIIFELTGYKGATILPLMFVCIISNITARTLKKESLHLEALRRRGVVLPRGPEESIMQNLRVSDVMHDEVDAVKETEPFANVVEQFLKSPRNNLYVVDEKNRFLGAISLHAMKEMLRQGDSLDGVIALDLVDETFDFVTPDQKLADTMEIFWKQNAERLPVVNDRDARKLIGWISKRDLFGIYTQEILQKRMLMSKYAVGEGETARDIYIELPKDFNMESIKVPDSFVNCTVGEISPGRNYGVQLLQIRHHDPKTGAETVEPAHAGSLFCAGDHVVVVGPPENIAKFKRGKPPESVANWEI